jgi:type I restriction enzyme S subunit
MTSATPEGWKRVSLGDLGRFTTSSVDKLIQPGERPVQLLNYMDVYRHRRIDRSIKLMQVTASEAEVARYQVQVGDILFTPSSETPDDIGHSAVVADELPGTVHSYHTVRLRPDSRFDLDLEFRGWMANNENVLRYFANSAAGSTRYTLGLGRFASATLDLPPISEQRRIAEILSTLDEAIAQTEALIAKHQQIKAGLMHDLFTRGVTPDGHLRPTREQAPDLYKESPPGWIPKEWQYELLDDLAVRGSGHTPNKNFPGYWNGGIKWISLADSYRLDRLYIADTEYEISQLGIQNSSATVHPAGTVVLSRDAGVGKSAITTEPMAVSQHFMCWRCDGRLNKHFLYYWLQFKKRMFENIAMGSTILTIGLPYFKKLKIAAPKDPEEQKMIVDSLLSADEKIFSLVADLEKKKQQKHGLMHDLLTGHVRVPAAKTEEVST